MPDPASVEIFMNRCLELAAQGIGSTAPNPMVGAVIENRGLIIGEGYHSKYGSLHAEPNAINRVINKELLRDSTLYVNLEPCSHHGKTPPCANLIVDMKIPRVVIGSEDPNPLVSGKGISILRENGVEVLSGVLTGKCRELNKRFFCWHQNKRPWVILKWARSADGFIDLVRPPGAPVGPNWITSPIARTLVHKWRSEEQAILVGTNTVIKDNPKLNVRNWPGKNPLRVVIDRKKRLDGSYNLMDNSIDTLIFTQKAPDQLPEQIQSGRLNYCEIEFDDETEFRILDELGKMNIQSLIIEGGAFTLNRFIKKGLWDEARIFTGPAYFNGGIKSPELSGNKINGQLIGNSMLEIIYKC